MRIATIVGARPQFIKASALAHAFRTLPGVEEVMIHTGQHYDDTLSEVFFQQLDIPEPTYNLGVGSASHGIQTGRMLAAIEPVLLQTKPDCVLVYGDTNSTLAGSLAAVKLNIPLAHVEAGLRAFNRSIPEEINRILADHCSDMLFAPSEDAVQNLQREGISNARVHFVGDVMYDVALQYGPIADTKSRIFQRLGVEGKDYVLATIHRPSNTDNLGNLVTILSALTTLANEMPVILPLHPRTRYSLLEANMLDEIAKFIRITEPLGYLDIVMLEKHARLIATDSGGMQKEAFFHRVPCVTLREDTEWQELVDLGWNRLAPPRNAASVLSKFREALEGPLGLEAKLYGDGHSAERIAQILLDQAGEASRGQDTAHKSKSPVDRIIFCSR